MGSHVNSPDLSRSVDESDDVDVKLGDLLSGRLADVDVDSVAAVRELREKQ